MVLGSWSWSTGWLWDSKTDRLLALYIEDGFGVQGGFNVSTAEYGACRYTSLSTYEATGLWNVFTLPANETFITFFKMRGYWHFYWVRLLLNSLGRIPTIIIYNKSTIVSRNEWQMVNHSC